MPLTLLFLSFLLEFALYFRPFWLVRRVFALLIAATISSVTVWFAVASLGDISSCLLVAAISAISSFRVINMARIAKGRMHPHYLRHVTLRTSVSLAFLMIVTTGIALIATYISVEGGWILLAGLQLVVAVSLLISVHLNLGRAAFNPATKHFSDAELPTLTVAIPARNETSDLEACVQSLLASNYPKLEIVVIDDCSQDATADIIKSFAHQGVRFIHGKPPEKRWLAKNQAYQRLYEESSGELLLFCGVDTRFSVGAVKSLVTYLESNQLEMLSVLPRRTHPDSRSAFIQPMRYWWELAPPRWLAHRPPVLSTCWLIRKQSLKREGTFAAICHAILPEGYFARALHKRGAYRFVRTNKSHDVQTVKSVYEQEQTVLRTQYPKIRRRPEIALLLTVFDVILLLGPFLVALSGFWAGFGALQLIALLAAVILVVTHLYILYVTDSANVPLGLLNYPVVVLVEIYFGYASMFGYEFGTVEWKGRNICIPVMHVIPKLPDLPSN